MTDSQFEKYLEKSIKKYGDDYITITDDLLIPHNFSRKFNRRMFRLLHSNSTFTAHLLRLPPRRRAAVLFTLIILLSTMAVSVSALRNAFGNFYTFIFDTHTRVNVAGNEASPERFEDIYDITCIPDGYELTYQDENYDGAPWLIRQYKNDGKRIIFTQYLHSYYDVNVNTEGYEMKSININGYEGFIVDMDDMTYIAWDTNDYILELLADLSESQLISIAESVQKVEQ